MGRAGGIPGNSGSKIRDVISATLDPLLMSMLLAR
jgi:hypothetical protein